MRVYLRHVRTGYYYNGNLNWVAARNDATDFGSVGPAVDTVAQEVLDGMSMELVHDGEEFPVLDF